MDFDPITLTFQGMTLSSRSLLESLGSLEDFLAGENPSYSAQTFIQWLKDVEQGSDESHIQEFYALKNASTIVDDEIAKAYLKHLSDSIQEWERLQNGGD